MKTIDRPMSFLLQPPRAAQINYSHSPLERLRCPLSRSLVGSSEEQQVDFVLAQLLPLERMDAQLSIAEHVRVVLGEIGRVARLTRQEQRLSQMRMSPKNAREFKSGITGRANDRGLELRAH